MGANLQTSSVHRSILKMWSRSEVGSTHHLKAILQKPPHTPCFFLLLVARVFPFPTRSSDDSGHRQPTLVPTPAAGDQPSPRYPAGAPHLSSAAPLVSCRRKSETTTAPVPRSGERGGISASRPRRCTTRCQRRRCPPATSTLRPSAPATTALPTTQRHGTTATWRLRKNKKDSNLAAAVESCPQQGRPYGYGQHAAWCCPRRRLLG